jgi:hypothetical protein
VSYPFAGRPSARIPPLQCGPWDTASGGPAAIPAGDRWIPTGEGGEVFYGPLGVNLVGRTGADRLQRAGTPAARGWCPPRLDYRQGGGSAGNKGMPASFGGCKGRWGNAWFSV